MDYTIHSSHTCYACGLTVGWVGNVFGHLTVSHGNEVDATVSVSQSANPNGQVQLSIQLQCPNCGAVNQFKALHKITAQLYTGV